MEEMRVKHHVRRQRAGFEWDPVKKATGKSPHFWRSSLSLLKNDEKGIMKNTQVYTLVFFFPGLRPIVRHDQQPGSRRHSARQHLYQGMFLT